MNRKDKNLYETYKNESCPVCGYYCQGKGGYGCIDKPKLCGINMKIKLVEESYE